MDSIRVIDAWMKSTVKKKMSLDNKSFLCGVRPKFYKIYKCGLALFLVTMLIYGYTYQKQNPLPDKEDYWYTGQ